MCAAGAKIDPNCCFSIVLEAEKKALDLVAETPHECAANCAALRGRKSDFCSFCACACVCVCVRVWASLPGRRSVCRCDVWVRNLRPLIMREADDAASRKRQVCPLNRLWGPPHSWAHPAHSRTRAPARYHAQGMCFTVCAGADVCAGSRHRRADTAVGGEWPAAFVTLFGTHRLRLSAAHQCMGARR